MPKCTDGTVEFGRVGRRVVQAAFDGGDIVSDGGVLLLKRVASAAPDSAPDLAATTWPPLTTRALPHSRDRGIYQVASTKYMQDASASTMMETVPKAAHQARALLTWRSDMKRLLART